MPELPDVEYFRKTFRETSLQKTVQRVGVRDDSLLEGISSKKFISQLQGNLFEDVSRHGKYLFTSISDGNWMVMHFGMTGDLIYRSQDEEVPEYTKIIFYFDRSFLSYVCVRKLGNIRIVGDKESFIEKKELGPDALDVDFDAFYPKVKDSRAMLKSVLMNQSIISGIGNVYADEICFQLRRHPKIKVSNFNKKDWQEVLRVSNKVLKKAREAILDDDKDMPGDWLINHRGKQGRECPRCQGEIKRIEVSGRGTYFCPSCQEK